VKKRDKSKKKRKTLKNVTRANITQLHESWLNWLNA